MNLVDLTSPDEVRAVLGVSVDELEDATLSLSLYVYNLEAELADVGPSLYADYMVVHGKTSKTATEDFFYKMTRLFATYVVANQLTTSLPLFAPKDVTDGKAAIARFASSPYEATITSVRGQYATLRGRLEKAYAAFGSTSPSTVARVMFASSRGVDPVTGA